MTIGNQPTISVVNNDISNMAVQTRNLMNYLREKITYYQGLSTPGLEAIGMAAADATAFMNMISDFNAVAGVYYGTQYNGTSPTNGVLFNFDSAFSQLWGGN